MKALDYLAAGSPTVEVNLGTGVGSSVLDVIRAAEDVAGRAESALDEIVRIAFDWHARRV